MDSGVECGPQQEQSKESRGRAKRKSEEGAHRHSYSYKGGALEAVRPVVSEPVVESGSSGSLATFLHHHHGSTVQLPLRCGALFPPTTTLLLLRKLNPTPSLSFPFLSPCCSCRLAAAADPSPSLSLTTSPNCRCSTFSHPIVACSLSERGGGKERWLLGSKNHMMQLPPSFSLLFLWAAYSSPPPV